MDRFFLKYTMDGGELDSESLLQTWQSELLTKGKSPHREVEFEGSRRQTFALTNRNFISRLNRDGQAC